MRSWHQKVCGHGADLSNAAQAAGNPRPACGADRPTGGAAAFALIHLIALITNIVFFHQVGWNLPNFADLQPSPSIVLVPMAGALIVSCLAIWAPQIRGHGIPEAMEAVLTDQSRIPPRTAVAKPISSAIAIGTGGPFGAEGPIIVTGGALGS